MIAVLLEEKVRTQVGGERRHRKTMATYKRRREDSEEPNPADT
jgi:hypothetical protein